MCHAFVVGERSWMVCLTQWERQCAVAKGANAPGIVGLWTSWEEGGRGVEPWSCSMVAIPIWRSLFFLLAKFVKKRTWKLKFQIWSDLWGFQLLEVKKKKGVKIVKSLYSVSVSNQKCWRIIEDLWFIYIWFYSQIWAKSSYEWLPFAHICVWMITHFGCITKFIWKKNTDLEFGRHTGMY